MRHPECATCRDTEPVAPLAENRDHDAVIAAMAASSSDTKSALGRRP